MRLFHSIFLFIQIFYLSFFLKYATELSLETNVFPLFLTIFINLYLIIVISFSRIEEYVSKTITIMLYTLFIFLLTYLFNIVFYEQIGVYDNVVYLMFLLSITFFLYYIFDFNEKSFTSTTLILLFLIYFESSLERINSYFWINGDVLFFYSFFGNVNINFNLVELLIGFNYINILFWFIFLFQVLFVFLLFINNFYIKIFLLVLSVFIHLFFMFLFQNTFYEFILLFLHIPLFVAVIKKEKIFDFYLLGGLPIFFLFVLISVFIYLNVIQYQKYLNQEVFTKNTSLENISVLDNSKISLYDRVYPLHKFSYKQVESLHNSHKGIFSSRYIKVYWNNQKIFSTINSYENKLLKFSPYNNLYLSILNYRYKENKNIDTLFKYIFKDIKTPIVVEQGYLYLEDINDRTLKSKTTKVTLDYINNIKLDKDFFSYIIENNKSNKDFIYIKN